MPQVNTDLIAKAFKSAVEDAESYDELDKDIVLPEKLISIQNTAYSLAHLIKQSDETFDVSKFIKACNV